MKKITALLLCLAVALLFCGCSKSDKKENGDTVDLEYYVKLGRMPECEFSLGTGADEVLKKYEETMKTEDGEELYSTYKQGNRTCISTEDLLFFYDTADKEKKINYIVSYGGAYGFEPNCILEQITNELKKGDLNAPETELSEEETFFFPVSGGFTGLKYSFGENTACFVIDNNMLCACALYIG